MAKHNREYWEAIALDLAWGEDRFPIAQPHYMHEVVHVPGWGWMMPSEAFDTDRPWRDADE